MNGFSFDNLPTSNRGQAIDWLKASSNYRSLFLEYWLKVEGALRVKWNESIFSQTNKGFRLIRHDYVGIQK